MGRVRRRTCTNTLSAMLVVRKCRQNGLGKQKKLSN
jgi:hypothetical protein